MEVNVKTSLIMVAALCWLGARPGCSGKKTDGRDPCTPGRCGMIGRTDCGTCPGLTEVCSADGWCVDVCQGKQCGVVGEVDCGTCPGPTEVCTSEGRCADLCEGRHCGQVGEAHCGPPFNDYYSGFRCCMTLE